MDARPVQTEEQVLLREDRDGIATLTLNRPGQFNSLSVALLTALQDQLDAIAEDRSVRVVVVGRARQGVFAGPGHNEMREK
ncbi:MAG: enoyl-CoA hydratase/isomerase family protein, partial [Rhodospirillales bacterium]|nr:enoyl-CoA hydratase/isomerase family protein [Rhodospirillales bacterium]